MAYMRRHIRRARMNNEISFEDAVKIGVPMFIRLLELAREDITKDIDLHFIAEKCVDLSKEEEVITMDDYDDILEYIDEKQKD